MTKLEEIKKGHKMILNNGMNNRKNEKNQIESKKRILLGVSD